MTKQDWMKVEQEIYEEGAALLEELLREHMEDNKE